MKTLVKLSLLTALSFTVIACQKTEEEHQPAEYVNPFIGTDAHGHTYPGASLPFGMVQLSPQTRLTGWDGCSGYHFSDSIVYGFAHTALNGTGCSDYGDILIMPISGEKPQFLNQDYCSQFDKNSEVAKAGYYSVYLTKPSVLAELTASQRAGYHRYTFTNGGKSGFIIDLEHRDKVLNSWIEVVSDTEIRGLRQSSNWAKDMVWYFYIKFSKPFEQAILAKDNLEQPDTKRVEGTNVKAFIKFDIADNEAVEIKVGLSAVDESGALKNLESELPDWDFAKVKQSAFDTWNNELSKIEVNGGSTAQNIAFYTALYRTYLQPNVYQDIDGRYRGMDKNIHTATDFTNYTVFSLWDTYRTYHPLMTIIEQKRTADFINTMLNMYRLGGLLPIWELSANETYCMIGNHAISVIADAYMKGIEGFDAEEALKAMINSAEQDHFGLKPYREHGYIPGDKEHESISKTLEYAYNDWCIAVMSKKMGKDDVYQKYIKRAQSYKNILDPETGFMRPKLNGGWLSPFDPTKVDWHFTEANSWQYSFYVPQDITGFYSLLGGKERMIKQLDELFTTNVDVSGRDMKDITGLIGQYAHGNEPSHHMAYLYVFANEPWKTQHYVRKIMDEFYTPTPDGSIGNEDCGQMSAWLVMSAMGFYPVTPGAPEYIIGTPWFPEMSINLENGNRFKITAKNLSAKNKYINSLKLNGVDYPKSYISHNEIISGGHLEFYMTDKPNKNWAAADENVPVTHISDNLILPVPVINSKDRRIRDSMVVEIIKVVPDCRVFYTLDESEPDTSSTEYTSPFALKETATVKAVAYNPELGYSFVTEADFVKINLDKKIEILSKWSSSYHAGGAEALIDGVKGQDNWRLGNWQGYQGTDFEAIVDLGKVKAIKYISAGFVQDIRSWIWMPKDVTFYGSKDGKTYQKLATVKNLVPIHDYTIQTQNMSAKVNATVRYVKVKATNFGEIPSWHLGAGGQAFIFIDEIDID